MKFFRSIYHYLLAWLGDLWFCHPSRQLFVIGVTGTKGKSTVIELINAILERAGKKTAIISSVRVKIDNESQPNLTGNSMPGRFFIQRVLRTAVDRGCQYAVIEVTSQGVLQHRHRFIDFDAALVTNLEPEHIEAHGSFEKYRESKVGFFRYTAFRSKKRWKYFFVNSGFRDYQYFVKPVEGQGKIILYHRSDVEELKIVTRLIGEFNFENIAGAVAFVRSQGIDWESIREAIENFNGVPGRLEFIQKVPFSVVIDLAHTPDSLKKVLVTLRNFLKKQRSHSRLILVFGSAGGGRDVWKRPVMGEIAAEYADHIILTSEDPYDNEPAEIINQIEAGMAIKKPPLQKIIDRKQAILRAIKMAKPKDLVVITGKGCEPYFHLAGGKTIPWDEQQVVKKILNNERIEI